MQRYLVRRYYMAVWDKTESSSVHAATPHEAAEKVCGSGVRESGSAGELCAEVRPATAHSHKTAFYRSN
jgi:hypothetical protein